jgi:Flp pilus assembly protein TadD
VELWLEATRLQPRRAEVWANLGSALGLGGKLQEAVQALAHAAELEPRDARLLARLAFAEHAAGRIQDAVRHLRATAELSGPDGFRHSGALGLLLLRLDLSEEARGWLGGSRPGEAEFAEARLQLAILEAESGRGDQARQALREALRADPGLRSRAAADARLARLLP